MNKKLNQYLKSAFDTPTPIHKKAFLQNLNFPKTSSFDFTCSQVGYIRKRVWVFSSLILISILVTQTFLVDSNFFDGVWFISSVLPFVSLLSITEIARSTSFNMEELELSCKHSLSNIILTRLGVLGVFNFAILGIILFFLSLQTQTAIIKLGVYILVPFLLTTVLSLFTLNYLKCRETTYICGGISVFVSVINSVIIANICIIYADKFFYLWVISFSLLLITTASQIIKLLKKTEELNWNLLLTV